MSRSNLIFVLILWANVSPCTFALDPIISPSPLNEEIHQPVVSEIFRDQSGILWLGTQEGLYRLDGSDVTVFNSDKRNKNWIPASDIRGIEQDIDGGVIIATYGAGLLKLHIGETSFRPAVRNSLTDLSRLTNMRILRNGSYLVGAKDTIALYEQENRSLASWISEKKVDQLIGTPFVFAESTSGDVFVGSNTGLTKISVDTKSAKEYAIPELRDANGTGVTALKIVSDDLLLLGTDSGHVFSLRISDGFIIARTKVSDTQSVYISNIEISHDRIVIGTDRGLYLLERDFSTVTNISKNGLGLSNNDIHSIYSDDEYAFIGTYNGLDVLSFSPFSIFNSDNSNVYNDILTFDQDNTGRIWIGTYSGLFYFDTETKSHHRINSFKDGLDLSDQRVTALETTDSHLWLGYYQGAIQRFSLREKVVTTLDFPDEYFVTDIFAREGSDDVWIGTFGHGLIRYAHGKFYNYLDKDALPESKILVVFGLSDGSLLISTTQDLYTYDIASEHFVEVEFGPTETGPLVLGINEDRLGNIWIGTKDQGLFLWERLSQIRNGAPHSIARLDALKYDTVYGIELDHLGNLWCSTQNGIVKLDQDGNLIEKFTTSDGLQGNDFNFGASFTSREGLIYFGGVNGYNRFDPSKVEIDRTASPMRLTGITLPGEKFGSLDDISQVDTLHLSHDHRSVTFEFSVLDFIHPGKSQFRYMLQGFDPDWVENGTKNSATYTSLPSGDYVLKVQGSNSSGIWNREGLRLKISVAPPPWRSWWAFILYALGIMFIAWSAARVYRSYILDRESKLMAIELFEAENMADDELQEQIELQDEIVKAAYDHNQATLSLVRDCITHESGAESEEDTSPKGILKRLTALSRVEDCLSFYEGGPVVDLKRFADITLDDLLLKLPVNPDTLVTINEVIPRLISAEFASPLALIIFELLENCVLHAFDPNSPANYIHVTLDFADRVPGEPDSIDLVVSDSGIGLSGDPAKLVEGSNGLGIVQALVEGFGGTLTLTVDEGTIVSANIPIPPSIDF